MSESPPHSNVVLLEKLINKGKNEFYAQKKITELLKIVLDAKFEKWIRFIMPETNLMPLSGQILQSHVPVFTEYILPTLRKRFFTCTVKHKPITVIQLGSFLSEYNFSLTLTGCTNFSQEIRIHDAFSLLQELIPNKSMSCLQEEMPTFRPVHHWKIRNHQYDYKSNLEFLSHIVRHHIGSIVNEDPRFLKFFPEVRRCLPGIRLTHLISPRRSDQTLPNPEYLGYCHEVCFASKAVLQLYKERFRFDEAVVLRPTRVITFGTFDLLHHGHINVFTQCKSYGEEVIVGVSSDALNTRKGKSSFESQEQRIASIRRLGIEEIFLEESLEKKNDYVNHYKADILIMGDDWLNKFDFCDCLVHYIPRTPDISSTFLKSFSCIENYDIAHGGGEIDGYSCTNSLEAIEQNLHRFRFIEVDVVAVRDGFVMAHDGKETSVYDSPLPFSRTTTKQFETFRVCGRFSVLTFSRMNQILLENPKLEIVMDTKFRDSETMERFCIFLSSVMDASNQSSIILQVYNLLDCQLCVSYGWNRVLFAMWKQYSGKFQDPHVLEIIRFCLHYLDLFGISIASHLREKISPVFMEFIARHEIRLFFHGIHLPISPKRLIASHTNNQFFFLGKRFIDHKIDLFRLDPFFDAKYYARQHPHLKIVDEGENEPTLFYEWHFISQGRHWGWKGSKLPSLPWNHDLPAE